MGDLSFDVVIIGGGCKGLSTGMYLAKYGGMSVGIFDELHELGGGLCGEQVAGGFQANPHSSIQMKWYYDGVIKDDLPELWEEGFKQGDTIACNVSLFPDDTCQILYGFNQDPDGTRTAADIAKFSERDAETYLKLRNVWLEYLQPAFHEEAFTVPPPVGELSPLAKTFMSNPKIWESGLDPHIASMNPFQALKSLFESEALITAFLRLNQLQGLHCDDAGTGLAFIGGCTELFTHAPIIGGTHVLTHAMHRVLYRYGAKTFTHSEVEKLIIENGTVKGIQLKDGTRVEARKAVVSTLSPRQLCYDLIGPDYVSPQILRKINALEDSRLCMAFFNWAATEYPQFKARDFNPDVGSEELKAGFAFYTLGPTAVSNTVEESCYRKMGKIAPHPLVVLGFYGPEIHLTPDPNQCLFQTEIYTPPATAYPEEWWQKFTHEHADWLMGEFQKYMIDMSWDKILGVMPMTPYHQAKHLKNMAPAGNWQIIDIIPSQMGSFRPIPELAQHRTPIKNLYATGSAFGGWGSSSFCSSYSCYKVMAEEYGLRKPWEEQGRPY